MHAEEFMTREPAPCAPNDPLAAAARTRRDRSAGALAVVEEGRGVGLVTDRPLAVRGPAEENPYRRVRDVGTRDPVRPEPDDPLSRAVDEPHRAGIVRRLPVVDAGGRLVGIVSGGDVAAVARDPIDVIRHETTHAALSETRGPTGGQRVADRLRRPPGETAPTERLGRAAPPPAR